MGPASSHRIPFRCIALATALLAGCAVAPDLHRAVTEEVHRAAQLSIAPAAREPANGAKTGFATLGDLLTEVISRDYAYRLAFEEIRLAGIDLTQAQREVLPRLIARGLAQMPITDGRADVVFSGGLYLRFDLMRALLYRNGVTVAQVTRESKLEDCQSTATRACFALFSRLARLEGVRRGIRQNEAARRLTLQACQEAEALFRSGEAASDFWYRWKRRREEAIMEQHRLGERLEKAQADLEQCFGFAVEPDGLRPLYETFVKRIATDPEVSADQTVDLLERAPAVNRAKLNLFLAEMGIIEARLKRLPTVSVDLAGGQIPIYGTDQTKQNGIVPMIGLSMPLLDMGDISRGIQRARIQADQAREQMVHAVQTSHQEMQSAVRDLDLARRSLDMARQAVEAAGARVSEARALNQTAGASAMEVHEAAWALGEAQTAAAQADQDYHLALLSQRATCGLLLDEPLQKEIFSRLDLRK